MYTPKRSVDWGASTNAGQANSRLPPFFLPLADKTYLNLLAVSPLNDLVAGASGQTGVEEGHLFARSADLRQGLVPAHRVVLGGVGAGEGPAARQGVGRGAADGVAGRCEVGGGLVEVGGHCRLPSKMIKK